MKNTTAILLLLSCCFLCSNTTFAQKAKFKNEKATCQKTRLPVNYVAPENRTYNVYKKGAYSETIEEFSRGIYGWKLDRDRPKMEAVISVYGFQIHPAKRNAQKKEKKDKDGKVTEKWTEYTYSSSADGMATLYIYGESSPFVYKKKEVEKSKAEKQKEAEAAAKKKDLEDNPFLSSEDVAEADNAGESDISEDSGLDGAMLPLAKRVSLDITENVQTQANRSASGAYKDYLDNHRPKLYKFRDNYPHQAYTQAMNTLNYEYGYSPINYRIALKSMKTDNHPEFKMWNDACQATQTLFKAFKYNKSIADNQSKFDPIINYFHKQAEQIPDDDRKAKNMKKAAFENLVNIMYYLDRHEELITLCQKYKDSKVLDRMANNIIDKSSRQAALLAFHKLDACHLDKMEDIADGDVESEEEQGEEEEEDDEGK